jgi:hypothetical protein
MIAPTVLIIGVIVPQAPNDYDRARAVEVSRCEAIDPARYQTGLALNPDGYRSFYVRSECFQKAAIAFRDVSLCAQAKRRWALFSSNWGYSPENCRKLVAEAVDRDRAELEELKRQYHGGSMKLRDFTIERNGNGRDYDVMPAFTGANGHGYTIAVEIVNADGVPVLIHSNGYYVDSRSALRLFIRQQEIKAALPSFQPGRSYQVRVVAAFSLPAGGGSRYLSHAFLERVFPRSERQQSVTRAVRF